MLEHQDTNGSEYVDWTDEDFDRADRSVWAVIICWILACLSIAAGLAAYWMEWL
jgi:hypothetical protein